ncbi:hypothetical protein, partial [Streptomyces alfalfae]
MSVAEEWSSTSARPEALEVKATYRPPVSPANAGSNASPSPCSSPSGTASYTHPRSFRLKKKKKTFHMPILSLNTQK